MLALFKDDDIKFGINNKELYVKNEVTPNSPSIPISGDFAFFKSPLDLETEIPQLMVGSQQSVNDGDLMITGIAFDIEVPISTVAYVDGEGAFTRNWGYGFQFSYANIESEGRRDYSVDPENEKNFYYIKDHLGSNRMVINEDCDRVESYAYTAYGVMKDLEASGGGTRERFTGKEFDTEGAVEGVVDGMNLNYFGARYYDPEVGIWLSTDPKEQFFNSYAYSSNPVNTIDPNGEFFWGLIGQMAASAAISGVQHIITNLDDPFGRGFVSSVVTGALSGAANHGVSHLLGNVFTFSPAANAFLEIGMTGINSTLIDAIGQKISYGKVYWDRAFLRGGISAGLNTLRIAWNGPIINPMRDFASVEEEINAELTEGHLVYHPSDEDFQADLSRERSIHRTGGLSQIIRAQRSYRLSGGQRTEVGRANPNVKYKGGSTWQLSSRYQSRRDYRGTLLHEIYHTYTNKDNEAECDEFSRIILELLREND